MSYRTFIRILLKNVNEKGIGSINFEIAFTHKETKKKIRRYVNTEKYIHKSDLGKKGIKTTRSDLKTLAHLIDKKKQELSELLRNLEIEHGGITPDIFDQSQMASADSRKDIFELFDKFIELKNKTVDHRTVQKYNTLKSNLQEFVDQSKFRNVYCSDITTEFLTDFGSYMTDDKDLSVNTVNKYQSCFNTFMDFITNTIKVNKNLAYREFKKTSRNRSSESKIVLLKEHVEMIIKWIPDDERLGKVRDLFVFQILTGIRFSDLERVNKGFVKNARLSFVMYKTMTRVSVPLHKRAIDILKKYDYKIGETCKTIKTYNIDVKEVCRRAGLTESVSTLKIKLNSKKSTDKPLCDHVSSHVGRTTFVTNCLIAGISPYIVMTFTGHTKIETLTYYMKIAGDMTQDAFSKYEQYFDF